MAVAAAALVDIPLHPLHLPLHHVHQLGQKAWLKQSGCLCLNNLWLPVPGWNRSDVWVYLTFLFVVLTRSVKHIHFLENLSVDCGSLFALLYARLVTYETWALSWLIAASLSFFVSVFCWLGLHTFQSSNLEPGRAYYVRQLSELSPKLPKGRLLAHKTISIFCIFSAITIH